MTRSLVLAAAAALALGATPSLAQQAAVRGSKPFGFFVGGHIVAVGINIDEEEVDDDDSSENGGGLGIQLGYGFRNGFALFANASGAVLKPDEDVDGADDPTLGHFDLGARYHFASPTRRLAPYLEAGFSGIALSQEGTFQDPDTGDDVDAKVEFRGTAFSVGGGIQYFVSPKLALDAGLRFSTGSFDHGKFKAGNFSVEEDDLDIDATTTRLNLGVVWYPRAR